MSYVAFAWLTTIAYALGSVIGKIASKHHIRNPWMFNFVWWVMTIICVTPIAMVQGVGLPQDWNSMMLLGVSNVVSGTLFVFAFYALDVSILSPLSNLRTPLVALVGVLFLGEVLTPVQWMLIAVIFLAGGFVNLDEQMSIRKIINRNTALALVWIATSVWFNATIKYASQYNGFWEVSLWSNIIAGVLMIPTIPFFIKDLRHLRIRQYSGVALSTVLYTAGLLFSIRAIGENAGISMAIMSVPLSMFLVMAVSLWKPALLERHTIRVYAIRLVSALVMLGSAIALSSYTR